MACDLVSADLERDIVNTADIMLLLLGSDFPIYILAQAMVTLCVPTTWRDGSKESSHSSC